MPVRTGFVSAFLVSAFLVSAFLVLVMPILAQAQDGSALKKDPRLPGTLAPAAEPSASALTNAKNSEASKDKGASPPTAKTEPMPKAAIGTAAIVLDTTAIEGLMGKSVKTYSGDDMGQIVDCLVTPAGQARAVVIDFGGVLGVGSRKVAVDWTVLDFSKALKGGPVILGLSRNEVRVSPEYKPGDPVVILEAAKTEAVPIKPAAPAPTPAPGPASAPLTDPKKN